MEISMAQEQPTAWESIIGQKQLTDNLRNALKYNKISQQGNRVFLRRRGPQEKGRAFFKGGSRYI